LKWLRWFAFPFALLGGLAVLGLAIGVFVLLLAYPNLPSIDAVTDYQPKVPLRVYTADGVLIGEFGEERRVAVRIQDVPPVMKQAILAAEDDRFYEHSGVDYVGVIRAAYSNLVSGGKRQGASTITMQVARNFFLSSEKTLTRKLYEALLAYKIESTLTKDQILEIYVNQIFLSQRAYGFAAASQIYYGKALKDVSIAEAAMLAGLPKAPSTFNPVVNPMRARTRQLYVLRRMHDLGYITDAQHAEAQSAKLQVRRDLDSYQVHAEYVAEMVRQVLFERYPQDVYTKGFRVYTTVTRKDQEAAYQAVRRGVLDYERRHGYRGPEAYVELPANASEERLEEAFGLYIPLIAGRHMETLATKAVDVAIDERESPRSKLDREPCLPQHPKDGFKIAQAPRATARTRQGSRLTLQGRSPKLPLLAGVPGKPAPRDTGTGTPWSIQAHAHPACRPCPCRHPGSHDRECRRADHRADHGGEPGHRPRVYPAVRRARLDGDRHHAPPRRGHGAQGPCGTPPQRRP